jgi:hypothetical protein
MTVRVEYEVRKLADSYVTHEMQYSFEVDEKAPRGRFGEQRQRMVSKMVEVRGGWLFIIRGKPGHTIRFTTLEQIEAFGLKPTPRLIDANTGEEVDKFGVPLIVRKQLEMERQYGNMSGAHSTDIDVIQNDAADADLSDGLDEGGNDHAIDESVVDNAIEKLEA